MCKNINIFGGVPNATRKHTSQSITNEMKGGWLALWRTNLSFSQSRDCSMINIGNLRWTAQSAALFIKALLPSGGLLAFQHWLCWFDLAGCSGVVFKGGLSLWGKIKTWNPLALDVIHRMAGLSLCPVVEWRIQGGNDTLTYLFS